MQLQVRVGVVLGLAVSAAAAQEDVRVVLFDFEGGVQEWWGNPWGGGECSVSASTDAKFGAGALLCTYRNVTKGANAVSPFLPEDAPWRKRPWGGISLWLKGDSSPAKITISVHSYQEGTTGYSASCPLEDDSWHRIYLPFRILWNREKIALDPSQISRLIIGCTGTHEFHVDQIALEPPGNPVYADSDPSVAPGPLNERLNSPEITALQDGRFEFRLDLSHIADQDRVSLWATLRVHGQASVRAVIALSNIDLTAREASVVLAPTIEQDGTADAQIGLQRADGTPLATWGYSFPVFGPEEPLRPPEIPIYPVPKELRPLDGRFTFGRKVRVFALGLTDEEVRRTLGMFGQEMREYYNREVVKLAGTDLSTDVDLVLLIAATSADVPQALLPNKLASRVAEIGDEGYILRVTPQRLVLVARSARGVYYGLHSLLAAIDAETRVPAEAAAPCCEVVDWPSFAYRGASVSNPTSRWGHPNDAWMDVQRFNDFVYRTFARQKLNKLVFIVGEGMEFESHPELRAPHAWSKAEIKAFLDFARDNYIEVIPLVTVLGHANWFTVRHRELVEPGNDHNIACVRLPETNALISEVFEEVIDLFEPTTFHIGMDECWWTTLNLPEAERCPRCKTDWPDIVAEQAIRYHDLLAQHGIRAMMWGDMLLPEHNGGPPYHTARALERIPKDMLIANWSTSIAPNSNKRFCEAGLTVVRSNSWGVPRNDRPYVIGNMMGLWSKAPWLVDTYYEGSTSYSFLSLIPASEFAWNIDPRLNGRGLDRDLLDERADSVLRRIALQPSPNDSATQTPLDLSPALAMMEGIDLSSLPTGEITVGRVTFRLPQPISGIALTEVAQSVVLPLGQKASSVFLLATCHISEGDRQAFTTQFHKPESLGGVHIGTVTFTLASGTRSELPLLYSYNVLPWDHTASPPYLCGSIGSLTSPPNTKSPARAYVLQWVNPQPNVLVESIAFTRAKTEAVPVVLAATVVAPRFE
ncbi:MAG: glycoside hydrolase family 20 zincin-like fold domain-containing protein [Candidatus Zipacnadales bacterium]